MVSISLKIRKKDGQEIVIQLTQEQGSSFFYYKNKKVGSQSGKYLVNEENQAIAEEGWGDVVSCGDPNSPLLFTALPAFDTSQVLTASARPTVAIEPAPGELPSPSPKALQAFEVFKRSGLVTCPADWSFLFLKERGAPGGVKWYILEIKPPYVGATDCQKMYNPLLGSGFNQVYLISPTFYPMRTLPDGRYGVKSLYNSGRYSDAYYNPQNHTLVFDKFSGREKEVYYRAPNGFFYPQSSLAQVLSRESQVMATPMQSVTIPQPVIPAAPSSSDITATLLSSFCGGVAHSSQLLNFPSIPAAVSLQPPEPMSPHPFQDHTHIPRVEISSFSSVFYPSESHAQHSAAPASADGQTLHPFALDPPTHG